MKLTKTQHEMVKLIVDIYEKKGRAIKYEEITKFHQITGGVKIQMQVMKSLKLVKSFPGHNGGYIPTHLAYENLRFIQGTERIPLYLNNRLSNVTLKEIQLRPPNNGILYVTGDIQDFKIGDRINIASKNLLIYGKLVGRDDLNNSLFSSIEVATSENIISQILFSEVRGKVG